MTTLYYSYSFRPGLTLDSPEPNRAPYHHTWYLGRMLRDKARARGWRFQYVNLDSTDPIRVAPDDIVVYHPWYLEGCFSQQLIGQDCRAKFVVQPYTEKMVGDEALPSLFTMWDEADWLFLSCGPYWWDRMPDSDYAAYQHKATRLHSEINPALHPHHKTRWGEPGKRAALCIGYDNPIKGLDCVADLARTAGFKLLHIGRNENGLFRHVPQVRSLPGMEFTPENIAWICDHYDVFITMGRYDANPTTLIETACWGLIPCCTPQCGYYADDPFVGLVHGDMAHNLDVIDWLQRAPAAELDATAQRIRQRVIDEHRPESRQAIIWQKMDEVLGATSG